MYIKNKDGSFTVSGRSNPSIKWVVSENMKSCNCPKFKFILKGQGQCHHMIEVIQGENQVNAALDQVSEGADFKQFVEKEYLTPLDLYDFMEVYGESQYRLLTASAQIMFIKKKVRLLK